MVNMIALGGGILSIIVGGVLLLVGAQIFAQLDEQFDCDTSPYNTSTDAQDTCTSIKSNVWLILGIAPYGLESLSISLVAGVLYGSVPGVRNASRPLLKVEVDKARLAGGRLARTEFFQSAILKAVV